MNRLEKISAGLGIGIPLAALVWYAALTYQHIESLQADVDDMRAALQQYEREQAENAWINELVVELEQEVDELRIEQQVRHVSD